ncbi:MAG: hypothetical protein Q9172_006430 [Xanthocarpia lactea]
MTGTVGLHLTGNLLDALTSTRSICVAAVPWLEDNRGPEIVGAITTLTVLATIAVVLRFLGRNISGAPCGVDDWLMLFALLFFAVTCIFPVGCTALKLSVLFFYHRIFPIRKFTIWSIVIGIVVIGWFIAFIVSQFLTCRPLNYYWDKSIPGGKCINQVHNSDYVTTPADILTNIAILILPIPWLWGLQMKMRRKVAVTLIFFLGSFAAVGSIVRIPFVHQLNPNDVSYSITNPAIWLNVEIAIGILSGSLPLMRPIVSRAFPSRFRSYFSRSSRNDGSQRLDDPSNKNSASSGSKGQQRGSNIYVGGVQSHKAWYNNAVVTSGDTGAEGSTEEIIPLGQIGVRSDVEWEQEGVSDKASGGKV